MRFNTFFSLFFGIACCCLSSIAVGGTRADGVPNLIFGVLSDIHIYENPESTNYWEKALRWYDEKKIDAMVVAGDMAEFALVKQLQHVADTWWKIFPEDTASDGRHVERIFVHGNHDIDGWRFAVPKTDEERLKERFEASIPKDKDAAWLQCFHEHYSPMIIKNVKGYLFLGLHWGEEGKITDLMEQAVPDLVPGKPFFYVQHPHPANTVYGPWTWGHDRGLSTRTLANYPDAVAFSGHSHYSLNDESGIWQDTFTSIGTSTLRYVGLRYGRENSGWTDGDIEQMKEMATGNGKQGLLVSVYDDCIILERHDFEYDCQLAEDWILPLPLLQDKPYNHQIRKTEFAKNTPEFEDGASDQITVTEAMGKDAKNNEVLQVTVSFPTALKGKTPAFDYEIQAQHICYDVTEIYRSKRVFAKWCYLSEKMVREIKTAECVFGADELPKNTSVQFVITPLDCFGNRGKSIVSKTVKLPIEEKDAE